MTLKWKMKIFTDWTLFVWRRFPTMLTEEFKWRIFILVGFNRYHGWWEAGTRSMRIGLIKKNFACYMVAMREQQLRENNPDCWGGDDWNE